MTIKRYSAGVSIPGAAASGQAYAELLAGAADPISVKLITITTGSNIGGHVGLSHSFAIGTGAATGIYTGVAHRLASVSATATGPGRAQIAWTSSGASPTGYGSRLKNELLPVATGQSCILWDATTDGSLVVEPNKSVILFNQGSGIAAAGLHVNFTWEEGRR